MGPLIYVPDETTLLSVQWMFMWASADNVLFPNLIGNRLPSVSLLSIYGSSGDSWVLTKDRLT